MASHPGVYVRGGWLWVRWTDAQGERQYRNSRFRVGDEAKAAAALEIIKDQAKAEKELLASAETGDGPLPSPKGLTIAGYWGIRLRRRQRSPETASAAKANVWHGRDYLLPAVGHYLLTEFRPRHAAAFVTELKAKKREDGEPALAPRTLHTVWAALRGMFRDAVIDELVAANPCVLKRGTLPKKKDRDPTWRRSAFFSREELEMLISDERIPLQRRALYAILFLAGLRPGEASALRWGDYDATLEPLGRLDIQRAYDTDEKREGDTKTEKQRLIPVHPTLAKVLAHWKLSGWEAHLGRAPRSDDLVVPNQQGEFQSGNGMRNRALADLRMLGQRQRRFYDTRRTFITRCQADLIPKDIYRWWTHGPPPGHDAVDLYASIDWPAHCREMLKLKVDLKEGMLLKMYAVGASNWDSHWDSQLQVSGMTRETCVGARGFEPAPRLSLMSSRDSKPAERLESASAQGPTVRPGSGGPVPLSHPTPPPLHESVSLALRDALANWKAHPDSAALKRDLNQILGALS